MRVLIDDIILFNAPLEAKNREDSAKLNQRVYTHVCVQVAMRLYKYTTNKKKIIIKNILFFLAILFQSAPLGLFRLHAWFSARADPYAS